MPSKMSWFNKELILQIGRSTGWISIIYFLGLLLTLPLRIIMVYSDEYRQGFMERNLFFYDFQIQVGLMIAVPVLLAVFLFRFLHVKQATDLMHSLPMTRGGIFHHYALTGIVFLAVPVTVISILLLIMQTTLGIGDIYETGDVFYWAGVTILINLLLYTAGVFIAMMTGISAVQAVLTYVMLLFPAGITVLLLFNIKIFLFGFPSSYHLNRNFEKMSPLTYAAFLDETTPLQWKTAVLYIILTILFYVLALFFYKKRNLEAASEAIAFPKLRSVFKYGVTFCMMLLGGMYFNELSYQGFGWTLFGYAFGAFLGYYVAEMVLKKTWRVFSQVKGLLVYSAAAALLVLVVQALGFYENKVPEQNEIKNVVFTDSPYQYLYNDGMYSDFYAPAPLKEKTNIENVLKLHEQIIADKEINEEQESYEGIGNFFFIYELENGKKVIREYHINMLRYLDFYKPIFESEEYKMASKEIFKVKENKVKTMQIRANGPVNKVVTLADAKEIKEAISILREDVLAESYEDSLYYQSRGSTIELNMGKQNYLAFEFKPSYLKFADWLKKKDMLEQAKLTGEDFSHVLIGKVDLSGQDHHDPAKVKEMVEQSEDVIEIKDKGQIELSLERAGYNSRHEYTAVFYYNIAHHYEVLYFDEEHAPKFVSEHFQ